MNISSYVSFHQIVRFILILSLTLLSLRLMAQNLVLPAEQNLEPEQVSLRNWVDRTALFPGDSLVYQIEIRVDTNMGILLDDLGADELGLTGLELISSSIGENVSDDGTTYLAGFHLATFETGTAALAIDELTVRYFFRRPGQRLENVAAAGEIVVPAVSIALQSTLPADPASLGLRDMGLLNTLQGDMRGTGTLGLILFLAAIVPLVLLLRRRLNQSEQQITVDRDVVIEETSAELQQLNKLDPEIPEQRLDGFCQLEHILKEYIEKTMGVKAASLTSAEISNRISESEPDVSLSELTAVLESCETARYGKAEFMPSSESFNKGLNLASELLKS